MNIFKMLFGQKEVVERSEDFFTFTLNDYDHRINKKKYDRDKFFLLIEYFKETIKKYRDDGYDIFILNDKEFKIEDFDLNRSFGIKYNEKYGDKIDIKFSEDYIKISDKILTKTSFQKYLIDGLETITPKVTEDALINRFFKKHDIDMDLNGYYEINGGTHYITIETVINEYRYMGGSYVTKDKYLIQTEDWQVWCLSSSILNTVLDDNPIVKKIDENPYEIHWEKIADMRLKEQKKFEDRVDDFVKDIIIKFDRFIEMQLEYKTSAKLHYTSLIDSVNFIHFCEHINHTLSFDESNIQKSLLRVLKQESKNDIDGSRTY